MQKAGRESEYTIDEVRSAFFSIVVPTFNSEGSIKNLLESIISQTFNDYEILIVDGSSLDNTINIINSIGDHRVRIISERDTGIYDAMNKGIEASDGQWLYFIGSDDTLYDHFVLEKVKDAIIENNVQHILYGDVRITGTAGWAKEGIYDGAFTLSKILSSNICHQNVFYNHKVFNEIGKYTTKYTICADFDFNLRCYSKYSCFYTPIIIAHFTAGGKSTSERDYEFETDFDDNILTYFRGQLFQKEFKRFRHSFMPYARKHLKDEGYRIYIRMSVLKIWHKFMS